MEQKVKVLIADPCAGYRRLVAWQINHAPDLELVGDTDNGHEALRIVREAMPNVVVSDIQLACLDGIGMIRQLREQQVEAVSILVSSFRTDNISEETAALGVYAVLLKPFNTETLMEVIRSVKGQVENPSHCAPGLECAVTEMLYKTGMPPHMKGHRYLREAIVQAVGDKTICRALTKLCYPMLARKFNTTPSRVERAMRHAIEVSWEGGNRDVLQDVFVAKPGKTPTNSEWIATLANRVNKQIEDSD